MGIYDREYYRDDRGGPGFFSGEAPACKALILINVAVFILCYVTQGSGLRDSLVATSKDVLDHGQVWRLLTATFVHADAFHILWNLLFLWIVGREVEAIYRTRDFIALYLTAAVIGSLAWLLVDRFALGGTPRELSGAAGPISAVAVIAALYHPTREILLFLVLPVPLWLVVVLYVGGDLGRDAFFKGMSGPEALAGASAHLAGAGYGFLFKQFDLRWSRLLGLLPFGTRRPRFRVVAPPEPRDRVSAGPSRSAGAGVGGGVDVPSTARPTLTPFEPEEGLDERLDEVLAKIAREGRTGLTDEENRILEAASRRARNRRGPGAR